jgi:hypothetical protein
MAGLDAGSPVLGTISGRFGSSNAPVGDANVTGSASQAPISSDRGAYPLPSA